MLALLVLRIYNYCSLNIGFCCIDEIDFGMELEEFHGIVVELTIFPKVIGMEF